MEPAGKPDETIENKRRRLIFRSDHRGTKEMDIILGRFAREHVPNFTEEELSEYDELLRNNDPDLYNWITGKETPPEEVGNMAAFQKLKEDQKNVFKKKRKFQEKMYVEHPRHGRFPHVSGEVIPEHEIRKGHRYYRSAKIFSRSVITADITKQNYAMYPRTFYVDMEEKCVACGSEFIFFALEQKHWFEELGFYIDSRCVRCCHCRGKENEIKKFHKQYQDLLKIDNRSETENKKLKKVALELYQRGVIKNTELIDQID